MHYRGALGTSVVKVFEATAALTGLSEKQAKEAGFDVGVAVIHKDHHASYYPGGKELTLKLVYERGTGKLLGGQAFGHAGVEKRIDVLATALHGQMTVDDLAELDLAYAPPYSSANDPLNLAAFVAGNDLSGFSPLVSAAGLAKLLATQAPLLLDVRTERERQVGHLEGDVHIPVDDLRARLGELPRDRPIAVYCRSGFRGHLATRTLKESGFSQVVNITGGWLSLQLTPGLAIAGR
jgi:rhodanese-related sulfurtransferase